MQLSKAKSFKQTGGLTRTAILVLSYLLNVTLETKKTFKKEKFWYFFLHNGVRSDYESCRLCTRHLSFLNKLRLCLTPRSRQCGEGTAAMFTTCERRRHTTSSGFKKNTVVYNMSSKRGFNPRERRTLG